MTPNLSLIILNYNRKKDLVELINSILKQTYKNFEIIVVDNASSDGSVEEIKRTYSGVKIVALEKNIGRSGHNKGANIYNHTFKYRNIITNTCRVVSFWIFIKEFQKQTPYNYPPVSS